MNDYKKRYFYIKTIPLRSFFLITLSLLSQINLASATTISEQQLESVIQEIENEETLKRTTPSYRWSFLIKVGPRPLDGMSGDFFLEKLFQKLSSRSPDYIQIDSTFFKTLHELRPFLLSDLEPNQTQRRYNEDISRKSLWKKINFLRYAVSFLNSPSRNFALNISSTLYPDTLENPKIKNPIWWDDILELFKDSLEKEKTYGELFDSIKTILEQNDILNPEKLTNDEEYLIDRLKFLRTIIAPVLGLHFEEKTELLTAFLSSVIHQERQPLFVCIWGPICRANVEPSELSRLIKQLRATGVDVKFSGCSQSCRASRHLETSENHWPKVIGRGMPTNRAPGVADVIRQAGQFLPPQSLCASKLSELRALPLRTTH